MVLVARSVPASTGIDQCFEKKLLIHGKKFV